MVDDIIRIHNRHQYKENFGEYNDQEDERDNKNDDTDTHATTSDGLIFIAKELACGD